MARVRAHVHVSGRVQGVMFRESMRREADSRGVSGWVRNLSDGRVEAVFDGPETSVQAMVLWCNRGPSRARVEDVQLEWQSPTEQFDRFEIREGWTW